MSATLLRTAPALRAGLRARAAAPMAGMATTFARGKATLPDLPCETPRARAIDRIPSRKQY